MPDTVHKYAGGTTVRVTGLDECGVVGDCYVVSTCVATVKITPEYIDPQDLSPINMDGKPCWVFETLPTLKWERYDITLNAVDVRMKNLLTGAPLYFNEAVPTPEAVGNDITRDMIEAVNFGMELWLRQGGALCVDGFKRHNYWISPWIVGGRVGESNVGNQVTTLQVTGARSEMPSPWGVGPYNVERDAVTDVPRPMLTPMDQTIPGQETIARHFETRLDPPPASGGCQDPTPEVTVAPLAGAAPLAVTLTFPLDPVTGLPIVPARIDWGDGDPVTVVTAGTNAMHSYLLAGTYNATFTPTDYSSPDYVSADIVVS